MFIRHGGHTANGSPPVPKTAGSRTGYQDPGSHGSGAYCGRGIRRGRATATVRAQPPPHSVIVDWIDAMLLAIELNPRAPTVTTWRMYVAVSSMYDAYAAYDDSALGTATGFDLKRPPHQRTARNREIAVSYAAHRALSYAYPDQTNIFDAVMEVHGLPPGSTTSAADPAGVGNLAAEAVIAIRTTDGSNSLNGFLDVSSYLYPGLYTSYNSADPNSSYSFWGADYDPNSWTPLRAPNGTLLDADGHPMVDDDDPSSYTDQQFLTPHWGSVDGFALLSADQFRPSAPPRLGSYEPYVDARGELSTNDAAFRSQAAQILEISGALTDELKVIAEFWADGPHTWTPPGHWIQLAVGVSLRDRHSLEEDIRMYLALAGAVLDAGIAAWDAKRVYDFARPVTAIRYLYAGQEVLAWAGPGRGIRIIDGVDWRPYQSLTFVTPPFAEYVSGHSAFSRAAAEVLSAYTGSPEMYDGVTQLGRDYDGDGMEDLFGQHIVVPGRLMFEEGPAATVVLQWDRFRDAADEAGLSRRYGGIHFQDADLRGREMGRQVGLQAYRRAELLWDPFKEVSSTVNEQAQIRNISPAVSRNVNNRLRLIQRRFEENRTNAACGKLGSLEQYLHAVKGHGVSDSAHDVVVRQLEVIAALSCT
jgi:hypothetical protein